MQISAQQLTFMQRQSKNSFTLTNTSSKIIMFKIKTTDIKNLLASPARGYIERGQVKVIEITCIKTESKFEAKLQIMYGQISQKSDTFQNSWAKINSHSINTSLMILNRKQMLSTIRQQKNQTSQKKVQIMQSIMSQNNEEQQQRSEQMSSESSVMWKAESQKMTKTKMPIQDKSMMRSVTSPLKVHTFANNVAKDNNNNSKQVNGVNKSTDNIGKNQNGSNYMKKSQTMDGNGQQIIRNSQNVNYFGGNGQFNGFSPNQLGQLCFVQSQLLAQRDQNERLKAQIRRNKELQRNQTRMARQYSINSRMNEDESQKGTWLAMGLIALIFFTIGVLISKF